MRDNRATRLVLALLLVTAMTFVVIDLRGGEGGPLGPLRALADRVFAPLEGFATGVVTPVSDFLSGLGSISSSQAQIAELRAENDRLRTDLETSVADAARVDELDSLLRIAGVGQYRTVPAQVIGIGPAQGFAWTVTIDAGQRDGVGVDMSVINGAGLVGRVVDVGPDSATVLLIVDATSTVGARVAGSREIGLLNGIGRQDALEYQLLDPAAQLTAGDALVTFGAGGGRPFAPGIPIGEVVDASGTPGQLTQVATVRPFADMSSLDLVGVVVEPPRVDPRDSVLPSPPPSPTATPTASPSAQPFPVPSASPSASPTVTP